MSCQTNPSKNVNSFCYLCAQFIIAKHRNQLNEKRCEYFFDTYNKHIRFVRWAPKTICKNCLEGIRRYSTTKDPNKKPKLKYIQPAQWLKPSNDHSDCYVCLTEINKFNRSSNTFKYPNYPTSVIQPILNNVRSEPTDEQIDKMRSFADNLEEIIYNQSDNSLILDGALYDEDMYQDENDDEMDIDEDETTYGAKSTNPPKLFSQKELNTLIRLFKLSKLNAQRLCRILMRKGLLEPGVHYSFFRFREKEIIDFFEEDNQTPYMSNIEGYFKWIGLHYDPSEWRLFIDSSKSGLKVVLLNNKNKYPSVPILHSKYLKENYEDLEKVLDLIKYNQHKWKIVSDIKVIHIILGMQTGRIKTPCFLCDFDQTNKKYHYDENHIYNEREQEVVGKRNVIHKPLVDKSMILFPPLHIKLGLFNQFVINLKSEAIDYLVQKFAYKTENKVKSGIFTGPEIAKILKDMNFYETLCTNEKEAFIAFKFLCTNFLGNHRSSDYKELARNVIESFKKMGCSMTIKLHLVDRHIDYFPTNCGDYSEEHGERFHQDVKLMEDRYKGNWNRTMLADYCWMLKQEAEAKYFNTASVNLFPSYLFENTNSFFRY